MAKPSRASEIDLALLAAVDEHPREMVKSVMDRLGLSRPQILSRVDALLAEGYLLRDANPTRPTYRRGPNQRRYAEVPLAGLEEHALWAREVQPVMGGVARNVVDICHHGFTEMVNNAVDHSGGSRVHVSVDRNLHRIVMRVHDDGVGIFRKITRHLALPDERLALLELAKGKLTTDPVRHSGEGVFFTSRMFDQFRIASGELIFDHAHSEDDDRLVDVDDQVEGTRVEMAIATDSPRTAVSVFERYSSGPDDYTFARTVVPVRLAKVGDENLVSRSQAKRLLQRVDRFRIVVLDFAQVTGIGQAFADEVFRVFANAHPEVALEAVNVVPEVRRMIQRARAAKAEGIADSSAQAEAFGEDP